jgi:hypothetical protein
LTLKSPAERRQLPTVAQGFDWLRQILLRTFVRVDAFQGDRQLQHGRALTGSQASHHHDLAVRKLQCIVMNARILHIDLTESGDLVLHEWSAKQAKGVIVLDFILKCQLGTGPQTNGYTRFANGGKTTGEGPLEVRRD